MAKVTRQEQEAIIIDHNRHPRNCRKMPDAPHHKIAYNPLCGDRYEIFLSVGEDGRIDACTFTGEGCAISKAATSLMTEALPGKTIEEIETLFTSYHAMVTAPPGDPVDEAGLGQLAVLSGVRQFPIRIKCATLSWRGALAALRGDTRETIPAE
jgi:nitrogen fixation NifU-like protein